MSQPRQISSSPRFIASVTTILGGQAATVVLALLSEVCFARLLGPAPRGQFSVCLMAIWFGAVVGSLGGDVPIVIWAARRNKAPSDWLPAILLWGILGCSFSLCFWTFAYSRWHASYFQGVTPGLAQLVGISIPAAILFNYLLALLTGAERFRDRAIMTLWRSFASLLGFLALVWLYGRTAGAALWSEWIGLAVGAVAAAVFLRDTLHPASWSFPKLDAETRSGLVVGLRGQLGPVTTFFTYRLDVFLVNYFFDPAQVGIYAVGVAVSESLWQIPAAVATALFPRTARTTEENATAFTCVILRQVLVVTCASAVVLALAAPVGIPLVFGARFAQAVPVIWWLLPGTIALSLSKVAASDLAGRSKTAYSSFFGVAGFLATVGLDLFLIPKFGIQGAALASSISYLLVGALFVGALRYELKVKWRELLAPSRAELAQYKQACLNAFTRARLLVVRAKFTGAHS